MGIVQEIPTSRRERNKLDKLRRIVSAARQIFNEKGFDLTTTQEVAERAEVGAGTLFLYVANKEDLLILAFVDEMSEVTQAVFVGLDRGAPVITQVYEFFCGLFDYHRTHPQLSAYLIREVSVLRNRERIVDIRRLGIHESMWLILERGQTAGQLRTDIDIRDMGHVIFASYWDCLRNWANGMEDEVQFRARLLSMLTLVLAGIGVRSQGC